MSNISLPFGVIVKFSYPCLVISMLSSIRTPPTCMYRSSTSSLINFEISGLGRYTVFRAYREKSAIEDQLLTITRSSSHIQIPGSTVMTIPGSNSAASDVHGDIISFVGFSRLFMLYAID